MTPCTPADPPLKGPARDKGWHSVTETKLRIGVDIATLRPPFTGIANYELQLLSHLVPRLPEISFLGYRIYRWEEVDEAFLASCVSEEAPLPAGRKSPLRYSTLVHAMRNQVRETVFSASVGAKNISLYHAFSYRPPGRIKAPVIPVVYDLSTIRHPETHPKARLKWMEPLEALCRSAPVIHTISEFSATEIQSLFGIPRERIIVVHPGVNRLFREGAAPSRHTLTKFGVGPGSYVLSVSTMEPRKNLKSLIEAYAGLSTVTRAAMPLIVVGARGWGDLGLSDHVARLEAEGSVRFAGYVSDSELRDLYTGARAMFYPSLYEGFGMPITEALACGTPVITSNTASMPEAGGLVARYVKPLDVEAWRQELERALQSQDHLDEELRQRRKAHAFAFSWSDGADAVEAMYRTILARGTA